MYLVATLLRGAVLCCAILCYAMLCYAMLCYAVMGLQILTNCFVVLVLLCCPAEMNETAANSICQSIIAVAFCELDYVSIYINLCSERILMMTRISLSMFICYVILIIT
jgi:hypothetical protein